MLAALVGPVLAAELGLAGGCAVQPFLVGDGRAEVAAQVRRLAGRQRPAGWRWKG